MKQHIRTEIIINAGSESVWHHLTNFANYHLWNPFIIDIKGDKAVGSRLTTTIALNGKKYTFRPTVTCVTDGSRFEWLGSLFVKGIFDGRHYFGIEALTTSQVRFIHGEEFSGFLTNRILNKTGRDTRSGFIQMNQALKRLTEQP